MRPPIHNSPRLFALLLPFSLALIAGCWDAGFTGRDDNRYAAMSPIATGQAPLSAAFGRNDLEMYMPLVTLSHRLDYVLFSWLKSTSLGTWAPGCRLMGLLYHVLAAFILWRWVLPRLKVGGILATVVAGVFLLHPVQSETICWIAERKAVLAGLFCTATLALYLRLPDFTGWRRAAAMLGVLALFLLALTSKITAVGLLPVLVCWHLLLPGEQAPARWRYAALQIGVLALAALPLVALNLETASDQLTIRLGANLFQTLLTDVEIAARYLLVLVWPPLSSPYYAIVPISGFFSGRFLLMLAIVAAVVLPTLLLPVAAGERRRVAFGWLWFFGALGPMLNLIPQGEYMHDRYLYFSLPGAALAFGLGCKGIIERAREHAPERVLAAVAFVILGAFVVVDATISVDWGSEIFTFRRAVRLQPESSYAHGYLGLALGTAAEVIGQNEGGEQDVAALQQEALAHLQRAWACPDLEYNVHRTQFRVAEALMLERLQRFAESRRVLEDLLRHARDRNWSTPGDLNMLQKAERSLRALPKYPGASDAQ